MMKPDDIQRLASRGGAASSNPPDGPSTTASSSEQSQRDCENDTTNTTTTTTTTASNSLGFDTPYKLYCFDDEHLLHRRCDDVNSPSSEWTSISQRIASSVEAMLLLDKYRNELCDRKSKHGRKCPYHPAIAETYTKMGLLHQHMLQEPEKALRCHTRALELLRKCCDEAASETTAGDDSNNSDKYSKHTCSQEQHQQDQQDRLELVQRCTCGIAVTLADIGHVQRSVGRNADALTSYQEAIDTFARAGASEHHPARNAALAGINLMTCG